MKRKIDLFTPKSIKNAAKNDDFRVFWAESDAGIEVLLFGTVGDANRNKPVTMRVNSFGGLAFDGLAIYNALADHPAPTRGIIESVAASAASLAVLGADRVLMQANAIFHIHEGLAAGVGHIADLRETIDWLEKFNAAAVATYAAKTGKSEKELAAALLGANGDGTKYTAAEALQMGFIDEILQARKTSKNTSKNRAAELAARAKICAMR